MKKRRDGDDISFLGKVFLFFRTLWEKIREIHIFERIVKGQKSLAHYDGAQSPYEAKLSFIFGMIRVVCIVALCVLLVLTLIFGSRIISYENVYYMFKDIGYISSFNESRPESLSYSKPVQNQSFGTFKNGLAVVSDSEIKFFTSTGRVTLTQGSQFVNPKITCSSSNALIYDQGRRTFSVYNSFIALHSEELDFPISYADMSDKGNFAVVTKSTKYGSVVRMYNSDSELEGEYLKNDHVLCANVSEDGRHVAVLSIDAEKGESVVSLNIVSSKGANVRNTLVLKGIMPYSCEFISKDRVALLCNDRVAVYDLDGDLKEETKFDSTLTHASFAAEGFVLAFEGGADGRQIKVFDRNGNVAYKGWLKGNVRDVKLSGNYAYVLLDNEIVRIETAFGIKRTSELLFENAQLVSFEDGGIMVCTDRVAYYISFD